jgi:galactonate dehydratase
MNIVDVKTHVMGTAWRNLTFVRVLTDEWLEGIGEVRMLSHTDALLGYFAEAVPNPWFRQRSFQYRRPRRSHVSQ